MIYNFRISSYYAWIIVHNQTTQRGIFPTVQCLPGKRVVSFIFYDRVKEVAEIASRWKESAAMKMGPNKEVDWRAKREPLFSERYFRTSSV